VEAGKGLVSVVLRDVGSSIQNVHGFFDSFWWAMSTVTTVGYDIYPVTTEGRIVAIFLMLTGIGTLGVYTAAIANYVIRQNRHSRQG